MSSRTSGRRHPAIVLALTACFSILPSVLHPAVFATSEQAGRLDEASLWLAAGVDRLTVPALGTVVADLAGGRAAQSLPLFKRAEGHAVLGGYAHLYAGRAELALNHG